MSAPDLTPERVAVLRKALADLTRLQTLSRMAQDAIREAMEDGRPVNTLVAHALAGAIGDAVADLRRVSGV